MHIFWSKKLKNVIGIMFQLPHMFFLKNISKYIGEIIILQALEI